ncbi:bifunctional 4-hydroxy-2-oxoglutarate aldolase/2-dehydro-3-deoxy-phosphogluconate aldolase [bacterium]|nr:bifunctional 4-hydroxy-2-oxoglutarate aldolase/2-dehydro-3-deoxy-phosphogluconate aldolase [bacterium]
MLTTNNKAFNDAYNDIAKRLELSGIIPLIKIDDVKLSLPLIGALTAANIDVVEITFRTQAAKEVIKLVSSKCPNILVGAGTVISLEQVNEAFYAGAKYIVTPSFNPKVVDRCIELGIPVFPGCSNPTDIEQAYEKGLRVVKFFPSELLGGVEMLKALSGPYPFMKFIPTGGINADNLNSYLNFNKVLCCGGTYIVDESLLKQGRFDEITRNASEAVRRMLDITLDHVAINTDIKTGTELLKTFSKLMGQIYSSSEDRVGGIEVVKENHNGNIGHIAFSCQNLERCLYYLEHRGFTMDPSTIVKENGKISRVHLAGDNAGFTIQLIKKC